jgi:hypothetical protein
MKTSSRLVSFWGRGVLNWTPTSGNVGDHLVTVNVINVFGTSGQTFTLRVLVGGVPNVLNLDASQITDAGTRLIMNRTPDRTYQIMVSTSLSDWTALATVTASSTSLVEPWYPEAKKHPIQFYQSVAQ